MFICEIWLFHCYIPQFSKSDMSKYRISRSVSESPFDFEITRVDCITKCLCFRNVFNEISVIVYD